MCSQAIPVTSSPVVRRNGAMPRPERDSIPQFRELAVPDQFPHHGEAEAGAPQGRLLNRAEAAKRLHVSKMTVRRLGAAGMLEEIRVGARAIRIPEESVERHLADRRVRHDAQAVSAA